MPQKISRAAFDALEQVKPEAVPGVGGFSGDDDNSVVAQLLRALSGTAVGAAKGVGDTATSLVGMVPGVTTATNAAGNAIGGKLAELLHGKDAVTPPVSKEQVADAFEPTTSAEKFGKAAEQIGEFFVPAGAASNAAVKGLVHLIPDAANPQTMKTLNKVAALVGRSVGEGASAGTLAAAHGDPHAGTVAEIGAAAPIAGAGVSALLASPKVQQILAMATAAAPSGAVPSGFAARTGTYQMIRKEIEKILSSKPVQRNAYRVGKGATRAVAGAVSELDQ